MLVFSGTTGQKQQLILMLQLSIDEHLHTQQPALETPQWMAELDENPSAKGEVKCFFYLAPLLPLCCRDLQGPCLLFSCSSSFCQSQSFCQGRQLELTCCCQGRAVQYSPGQQILEVAHGNGESMQVQALEDCHKLVNTPAFGQKKGSEATCGSTTSTDKTHRGFCC